MKNRYSRIFCIVLLGSHLAACAETVALVELFTGVDEWVADEIRENETQGLFQTHYDWNDDRVRFPDAAAACDSYKETMDSRETGSELHREYIRAMKSANCRAQ